MGEGAIIGRVNGAHGSGGRGHLKCYWCQNIKKLQKFHHPLELCTEEY